MNLEVSITSYSSAAREEWILSHRRFVSTYIQCQKATCKGAENTYLGAAKAAE